jgi:arylformamidase
VNWIDVSVPLSPGLPAYEGDPPLAIERVTRMEDGAICNLSRASLGLHAGTHIDAPVHFIPAGGGIETLPPEVLLGPAWLADASGLEGHLDAGAVEGLDLPPAVERVLFRTRNGRLWERSGFSEEFTALLPSAAEALVARGVRLVGIDYLSIAPAGDPAPTHVVLLRAGVVILEGLDLRAVEPGWWELACLPLLIPGADGAPARALLGRPLSPAR